MERLSPRPSAETSRGILEDPPGVILCFDNYRGTSQTAKRKASLTMLERGITAMILSRSKKPYTETNRPKIVCFAGEHRPDLGPGSALMKKTLLALGATESEIETRATTIATISDITQLHSYIKENNITEPLAIVTSDDHVERTEQEIVNHFNAHNARHPIPKIYVVSYASEEINQLFLPGEIINSNLFSENAETLAQAQRDGSLKGGKTEQVARFISRIYGQRQRDIVQGLAELVNHQHTPEALRRIKRLRRQFTKGRKNRYVKKDDRKPKAPYILPPC